LLVVFGEALVLPIALPGHTATIPWAFDLVFLGYLKRLKDSSDLEFDDAHVDSHRAKIAETYEQTANIIMMHSCFGRDRMDLVT
jgi:hypothetical protein